MNDFILYSGIIVFILLILTILFAKVFKKFKWHKTFGYLMFIIGLLHGGVALYKKIQIYLMYS